MNLSDHLNYFKNVNAQKQIDKLVKKYHGKDVIIYGAGEYFRILKENFDISGLNIIGIVDKKFAFSKEENSYGYNPITLEELKEYKADVMLITLYEDVGIRNFLKYELLVNTPNENVEIGPLIDIPLSYFQKALKEKNNVLVKKLKYKLIPEWFIFKSNYDKVLFNYEFMLDIIDETNFNGDLNSVKINKKIPIIKNYAAYKDLVKKYQTLLSGIKDISALKPCQCKPIRNYQLNLVEFMHEADMFFQKHDLQYFLMGGTLIGALRHKGFVPWDDDIDIGMMRRDYEKLKEILKANYLGVDISKIYASKTNMSMVVNDYLKKSKNKLVYFIGPKYIQIYRGTSLKNGVFIDIFPHDYYKDDYTAAEFDKYALKMQRYYIEKDNLKAIFDFFIEEYKNNPNVAEKSNTIYYGVDCFVTYWMRHNRFMTHDMVFPLKRAKFENYEFLVPNMPEEYVKFEYPNYMEFPPTIEIAPVLRNM